MVAVPKDERAKENSALRAAQDRVPHRRGVVGGADSVPGERGFVVRPADAGFDEAVGRGYLTGLSVDEERTHDDRG